MSENFSELIGYIAAFLTTVAFVPQAIQSFKTNDLSGISLQMYSLFASGVATWLIYGIMIGSYPVIVANAITLILSIGILILKIRSVINCLDYPKE